ncbi:FHA domain-containing protein [Tautonia sociabilis]|uniref:FHA domain-containing protein n=1 Tax=Tautonia sociabilis TaxID=2080755 RepID=A0A432MLZ7_9BACT|nr:FHA domain-containing protein [Tautonia sociabilis]RUL88155.1 hypothetical protein TsocGM_08430 [Tautonia sociabilis]
MQAAAFLHIRARDGRATRIVPLSASSVRVGRGRSCEIQLDEPSLAEVECLLRRRGDSWHLQPVQPSGLLTVDGRPADRPRPLPMGATLRLADRWLTLLPTEDDPEPLPLTPSAPEADADDNADVGTGTGTDSDSDRDVPPSPSSESSDPACSRAETLEGRREELARWEARLKQRERWLTDRLHERQWEARWRAAGSSLRNRPRPGADAPRPQPSSPRPTPAPPTPRLRTPSSRPVPPTAPPEPAPIVGRSAAIPSVDPPRLRIDRPATPAPLPRLDDRPGRLPRTEPASPPAPSSPGQAIRLVAEVIPAAPSIAPPGDPEAFPPIGRSLRVIHLDPDEAEPILIPGPEPSATTVEVSPTIPTDDRQPGLDPPAEQKEPVCSPPSEPSDVLQRSDSPEPSPLEAGLEAPRSVPDSPADLPLEDDPKTEAAAPAAPVVTLDVEDPEPLGLVENGIGSHSTSAPSLPRVDPTLPIVPDREKPSLEESAPERRPSWFSAPTLSLNDLVSVLSRSGRKAETPSSEPIGSQPEPDPESTPEPEPEPDGRVEPSDPVESPAASVPVEVEANAPEAPPAGRPDPRQLPPPTPSAKEEARRPHPATAGEWPSVRAILGAQPQADRRASAPRPKVRPRADLPAPTARVAPDELTIPGGAWLCIPLLFVAMAVGVLGVRVAWTWAEIDRDTGRLADRLASGRRPDAGAIELLIEREAELPMASWRNSTADQMIIRAALLSGPGPASNPSVQERAGALIHAAGGTSPNHPSLRFARAWRAVQEPGTDSPAMAAGLSRDVGPLAWTGRALLAAGKVDDAKRAYRAALELACRARPDSSARPRFFADPPGGRFGMPLEDRIGAVLADMADRPEWTAADWEGLLPDFAAAWLSAGRLLRERGDPAADRLLARAASLGDEPPPDGCSPAIHLASSAEAMALGGRIEEAARRYDEAVDRLSAAEHTARRPWMFNLADLRGRLDDREGERKALLAAMVTDPDDPVTAQAILAQLRRGIDLVGGGSNGTPARDDRNTFGE